MAGVYLNAKGIAYRNCYAIVDTDTGEKCGAKRIFTKRETSEMIQARLDAKDAKKAADNAQKDDQSTDPANSPPAQKDDAFPKSIGDDYGLF